MQTRCLEVSIRFISPNHRVSQITRLDGPSTTRLLLVSKDDNILSVQFLDKDDDVIKEINHNFDHVLEYTCEGWVDDTRSE